MKLIIRNCVLACWLTALASGIAFMFWHSEWKFHLPTPLPENYQAVSTGTYIKLNDQYAFAKGKPLLLHFFNPDCPCSRFNMPHFISLVKKYNGQLAFAVVLINDKGKEKVKEVEEKYGLHIPVINDNLIASSCGVYSTPQAVIIDKDQKLYYRGNYNQSRYCTNEKTNYAQIAINQLLQQDKTPLVDAAAFKSYGCQLPGCKKQTANENAFK